MGRGLLNRWCRVGRHLDGRNGHLCGGSYSRSKSRRMSSGMSIKSRGNCLIRRMDVIVPPVDSVRILSLNIVRISNDSSVWTWDGGELLALCCIRNSHTRRQRNRRARASTRVDPGALDRRINIR